MLAGHQSETGETTFCEGTLQEVCVTHRGERSHETAQQDRHQSALEALVSSLQAQT